MMINNFNKKKNFLTFFFMRGLLFLIGFACVLSFADVKAGGYPFKNKSAKVQRARAAYDKAKTYLDEKNPKYYKLAFDLMHHSARLGNNQAMYMLAKLYENGEGTEINLKLAFLWYEAAANTGHLKALVRAGFFWEQGLIGNKDKNKAKEYYNKVLEYLLSKFGGDFQSLAANPMLYEIWQDVHYRLGIVNEFPQEGTDPDYEEAFKHYVKGAEGGHKRCQFRAGLCYAKGKGVEKDLEKAEQRYLAAIDAGVVRAMEALVFLHKDQKRFKESRQGAFEAIKKAGSIPSQIQLAYYLLKGLGGEQDIKKAQFLLEKVIDNPKTDSKNKEWAQNVLSELFQSQKTNCQNVFSKES